MIYLCGWRNELANRVDCKLVELGLAQSRERARALIIEGVVLLDGVRVMRPSDTIRGGLNHSQKERPLRFVSRGGVKLETRSGTSALTRRAMSAATPVRLRADLPTVCSSREPARSLPSTSATDSWRGKSATIRASWLWSGRTSAT